MPTWARDYDGYPEPILGDDVIYRNRRYDVKNFGKDYTIYLGSEIWVSIDEFFWDYEMSAWSEKPDYARLSWGDYWLAVAKAISLRADCSRRQVGCVIVDTNNRIVSSGYNGGPPKGPSCLKGECPRGNSGVEPGSSYDTGAGSCVALHAEQNALLWADISRVQGSTVYVTDKPCDGCTRMLRGMPLDRVVWPEGEWTNAH